MSKVTSTGVFGIFGPPLASNFLLSHLEPSCDVQRLSSTGIATQNVFICKSHRTIDNAPTARAARRALEKEQCAHN